MNGQAWSSASSRRQWRTEKTGCEIICGAPTTLAVNEEEDPVLATVRRRKLAWLGHVRRHDSLSKTILQSTFEGLPATPRPAEEMLDGLGQSGRPCLCQNCLQRPPAEKTGGRSLLNRRRQDWRNISAESSLIFSRRSY